MDVEAQDVTLTLPYDALAATKCVDRARSVYLTVRPGAPDARTVDVLLRVGYHAEVADHKLRIVLGNDAGCVPHHPPPPTPIRALWAGCPLGALFMGLI